MLKKVYQSWKCCVFLLYRMMMACKVVVHPYVELQDLIIFSLVINILDMHVLWQNTKEFSLSL